MNKLPPGKAACIVACLLLASCGFVPKYHASGDLFGQRVETTVDSDPARYYLENYLQGKHENRDLSDKIAALHNRFDQATPSRNDLNEIAHAFSVDFASLFLAHRLLADECNIVLNQSFVHYMSSGRAIDESVDSLYIVLFVPGWNYEKNGHENGADFARPRQLASELGLENHLVELLPTGSVEQNADILAADIVRYSRTGKELILAGASSAGPAIHLALSELLDERALSSVKVWLNLGGILQGSPLVDYAEARPGLLNLVAWFKGLDKEAILSMGANRSRKRFARLEMDSDILVINYLGIPLSGQLSQHSKNTYPLLRSNGPNDGLTLLADAIAPDSLTVVALGSDHFFAEDPNIDVKTVALLKLIVAHLQNHITSSSNRCPRLRLGNG